jgi:transcriptional regulator with XRE-family HTH domain
VTPRLALGEELRRARERRGVSLPDIAAATKISRSLFEGLERGDCSRWPGGIYSRAYVREYARAIGLPADDVVARFVECFADRALPDGAPPAEGSSARRSPDASPPLRLTLSSDPAERRMAILLRARLFTIDAMLVLGAGAAIATATGADFWISTVAASLGCQAVSIFRTGGSTGWVLATSLRGSGTAPLQTEDADGPVAAGPPSVQLS